jgi:DnaJ-domain-containing protein 1
MNFRDEFGVFEGAAGARRQQKQSDDREPAAHIRRALRIMAIEPPVTLTELKSRYKELVKRLHPDANGGDRVAEDKLKDINQAYATIKKFLAA